MPLVSTITNILISTLKHDIIRLQVDGGCGMGNIKDIAEAGADMFVAGSAILKAPRTQDAYKQTIGGLRAELAKANVKK